MFSFFKRKKGSYPTESKWTVLKGEADGHTIIVRRNDSAEQLSGNPEYRFRIGATVSIKNPDEAGFPSLNEWKVLDRIEDELCSQFEKDQMSLHVLAITTNGMREFVFYSRTNKNIETGLALVQASFPAYTLHSYCEEDKDWDLYKEFKGKLHG